MARIPEALIAWLKVGVKVQACAEASGVVFRRQGADLIGRCPFHEDRTPSLVVTPAKNLWHCFGACQAGGTVIDWVMRRHGVSFPQAVELLQKQTLVTPSSLPPLAASVVTDGPRAIPRTREDALFLGQVIEHYHHALLRSPQALDYLERRGIGHEQAILNFKLGFANRTLPVATAEHRQRLQRLGILRNSGHEHFNGSIVIPVIDATTGEVTEIYGRKINDNLSPAAPAHLYLSGPHRGVWNAAALSSSSTGGEVILCEALIDALTFWCAGYHNVTASYGVAGFTADHRALFTQCRVQRVLIAYDRDDAGDQAALNLTQQLKATGVDCYRVLLPKGMDANEYALKATPASQSLGLALRASQRL